MKHRFIYWMWGIYVSILVLCVGFIACVKMGWIGYMPQLDELQNPINRFASQIFSADGKLLGTWSRNENRVFVPYDSIAPCVFEALVATEDVRFFEHSGIDARALGRAVIKRGILGNKEAGGGSTITQQLAKQLYSESAKSTFHRLLQKPIEWVIAVELERHYTKQEILTLYLNYFDFLHNAVGIRTAAKVYFNKHPMDLTPSEAALLVGMCKNPSYYNPVRVPDRCVQRRNVVFEQMVKAGYLSEADAQSLEQTPLGLDFHPLDHKDGGATYLREYLRRIMMAKKPEKSDYRDWQMQQYYEDSCAWEEDPLYGWCNKNFKRDGTPYDIYTDGLKVYTTVDTRMQRHAENAMRKHMRYLQAAFDREGRSKPNYPYANSVGMDRIQRITQKAVRNSERYRVLKAAGASEAEIQQAFNTPVRMTVFTYDGDVDTTMSPLDSIKYYKSFLRSSLVSIEAKTGYVRAYVGGLDYRYFQYDMAFVGRRQVGSTMKPFVYALAMQNGWSPSDRVPCRRRTYDCGTFKWTPKGNGGGMQTLKWGLTTSNNWVTAELMSQIDDTGLALTDMLKDFGIRNGNIKPSMVLCLGACELTVGEMASAYTAFANKGLHCAPILVTRIEDATGKVYEIKPRMNSVITEESSYAMIDMMESVINNGTGRRLRSYVHGPVAGKTGTTNENSDGWFVAYTPRLVTACWVGGEDRDIRFNSTAYGQGAAAALPIWGLYMKSIYEDPSMDYDPRQPFERPEGYMETLNAYHDAPVYSHGHSTGGQGDANAATEEALFE